MKNKYLTIILIAILMMSALQSQSQKRTITAINKNSNTGKTELNPIDIKLNNCLKDAGKDYPGDIIRCFKDAEESWQLLLDRTYMKLIEKLDYTGRQSLKDSQISWMKFRDSTAKFSDDMVRNLNNNNKYPDFSSYDKIERIKQRYSDLKRYLDMLENK